MQNYELRDRIEEVRSAEGEGTELVSLSVPAEKDIQSVRQLVDREHSGAENIKSDRTRKRVRSALGRIRRILRRYRSTPVNGMVLYAGVIEDELTAFVFDDLPTPVTQSRYECANAFETEPLAHVAEPETVYGLLVVERGGAVLGELRGNHIITRREMSSQVMGKTRAGGQSSERFARERERQKHEFFGQVAASADSLFLNSSTDPVDGLLLGGSTITRKEFSDGEYLDHRLRDVVLGEFSVEYANERGLAHLVDRGQETLLDAERREVRTHLDTFYNRLANTEETVAYGMSDVDRAIEYGAVDSLIVSDEMESSRIRDYEERVEAMGGELFVATSDFERGASIKNVFDGVAALLRFPIN